MSQPPPLPPGFWPSVTRLVAGSPWPPLDDEAVDRLIGGCRANELLPLLAASDALPVSVSLGLDRHRVLLRLYDERARVFASAQTELEGVLGDEPVVYLKGSDYGPRLYGNPGLRPMKDIDVLVRAERFEHLCRRLEGAGLRQVHPGTDATWAPSYHERAFAFRGLQVEVHQAFIQRARHSVDYEQLWRRAVIDPATGLRRLDDVDALAYHALAMAGDQLQAKLVRYVDLWLLLCAVPDTLDVVVARAREWRAARALYGALRMFGWLFPQWEDVTVARSRDSLLPAAERRFIDRWLLPGAAERGRRRLPPRTLQLWRKFGLMDDWSRRVGFSIAHLREHREGGRRRRAADSRAGK